MPVLALIDSSKSIPLIARSYLTTRLRRTIMAFMKFQRHHRVEFTDTPRNRAAFFAKKRREREAQPLFAEQIAEEQATRPAWMR